MACIVYFFVLSGNLASVAHWVYAIFVMVLYVKMLGTGNISKYRRIFLFTFAILFMISFVGNLYDERGHMYLLPENIQSIEVPMCHIAIPFTAIPGALSQTLAFPARISGHITSFVSIFLIWIIASLTIGRGWCSWVCFYGGWEDGFSRVAKKPRIKLLSRNKDIRSFQFGFFFFAILASLGLMASVYCEWFCPFKMVTEFDAVVDTPTLIATSMFIILFFCLVVIMPILTRKRTQCSALCPFGAFQSLVDRVSPFRIKIDTDKCTGCLKCAEACPFCAIDIDTITQKKGRPEITCAKCGECVSACKVGAIRFEFASVIRKEKKHGPCEHVEPKTKFGKFLREILDAKYIFMFEAYMLGVIVAGTFSVDALKRIVEMLKGAL
jgi:polyferredoxin